VHICAPSQTHCYNVMLCFIFYSLIKILSFATTLMSDETHSLSLPDFPVDNLHAIVQIMVIVHLVSCITLTKMKVYSKFGEDQTKVKDTREDSE